MSPSDIAIENVEGVLRGEIKEPSPGTLAYRVLAWADERATRHVPIVTLSYGPRTELELSGGI